MMKQYIGKGSRLHMYDSITWLIPNSTVPTFMDGLIAIAISVIGFLIQRFFILKFIQWNVTFLENKGEYFWARILEQFSPSIRNAILVAVLFFSFSYLFEASLFTSLYTSKLFNSIMIYYVFKGIYDVLSYYTDFPEKFSVVAKEQNILTPFFLRIMKVVVMVIALFTIASMWDFNLNGFLTGIGLTGVAMAFGIRDTLAHIFGGMSIALDKPFQIGDWVSTEDQKIEGFIEDINLRSTLIQTGDKGLVFVPNSYLVNRPIYNLSKRTKRKCEFYYDVSKVNEEEVLRKVCEEIRQQIYLHQNTEKEIIYVVIDEMLPHCYRMLVRFYVDTNDTGLMLLVKQDILFAMHQIFTDSSVLAAEQQQQLFVYQDMMK